MSLPRATLLLPALLAFTAWAPAARAASATKTLQYTHETVRYPASWKTGPKTKDLVALDLYYQWDRPGRTCASDTFPWARVTIVTDVAPCWPPDREFYAFVQNRTIDGVTGKLYRRKPPSPENIEAPDNCPGQSQMILTFTRASRCYNMKFLTGEKWLKRFFPTFNLIMDNFTVEN